MRTDGIIVLAPVVEFGLGVGDRMKQMFVETFIAKPSLERFNVRIIGRRSRPDEVEMDMVFGGPLGEGVTNKLWAIIHRDCPGTAVVVRQAVEDMNDALPGEGNIGLNRQTLPAEGVFNRQ